MNHKLLSLATLIVLGFFNPVFSQKTISVSDYDILPNTFTDVTAIVKKALEACKNETNAILVFPEGRYDFWPEHAEVRNYFISNTSSEVECPSKLKTIGLLLEGMKNLTIEGNGSLFMFHGRMITFALDRCENIRIRNVSMDFERPTMSELTFVEVSDSVVVAKISRDSWYAIIDGRLKWYGEGWNVPRFHAILVDPAQGTEFYSSWTPFDKAKAVEVVAGQVRFTGDFRKFRGRPGQVLTIRDPYRDHVGAFINRSKNIGLENVSMHYMHGLGIVSQFTENLHFNRVFVMPRPETGRMIAAFADCMHFSGCKGQITIENCGFKGAHDDPINVHGTHLQVTEIVSPSKLKLKFMHHQSYGFEAFIPGDTVAFVHSAKLQVYGSGVVSKGRLTSDREMEVEFAAPVPGDIIVGDCLENITWTPAVTIRDCRFERTNTRGLLITTRRKVLIENNTFFRTGMHAILIGNDASSWFESGPVLDVTIRNNTFQEGGYNQAPGNYVIAIAPENHELVPGYWVHRNIRIENNTFKVYDYPILTARSTENLVFTGNKILTTGFMPKGKQRPGFDLTACTKVQLDNNIFQTPEVPEIKAVKMVKRDIRTDLKVTFIK